MINQKSYKSHKSLKEIGMLPSDPTGSLDDFFDITKRYL